MNDVIKKWNDDIIAAPPEDGETVNVQKYLIDNNLKIIDLQLLIEINKITMIEDINSILKEILKVAYKYECLHDSGNISKKECRSYSICLLCKLDYLISINRIKIVEIQEVLINE